MDPTTDPRTWRGSDASRNGGSGAPGADRFVPGGPEPTRPAPDLGEVHYGRFDHQDRGYPALDAPTEDRLRFDYYDYYSVLDNSRSDGFGPDGDGSGSSEPGGSGSGWGSFSWESDHPRTGAPAPDDWTRDSWTSDSSGRDSAGPESAGADNWEPDLTEPNSAESDPAESGAEEPGRSGSHSAEPDGPGSAHAAPGEPASGEAASRRSARARSALGHATLDRLPRSRSMFDRSALGRLPLGPLARIRLDRLERRHVGLVFGLLLGAAVMLVVATLSATTGKEVPVLSTLASAPVPDSELPIAERKPPPATPDTCLSWRRADAADTEVVDCAGPHLFEQAGAVQLTE